MLGVFFENEFALHRIERASEGLGEALGGEVFLVILRENELLDMSSRTSSPSVQAF